MSSSSSSSTGSLDHQPLLRPIKNAEKTFPNSWRVGAIFAVAALAIFAVVSAHHLGNISTPGQRGLLAADIIVGTSTVISLGIMGGILRSRSKMFKNDAEMRGPDNVTLNNWSTSKKKMYCAAFCVAVAAGAIFALCVIAPKGVFTPFEHNLLVASVAFGISIPLFQLALEAEKKLAESKYLGGESTPVDAGQRRSSVDSSVDSVNYIV